MTLKCADQCAAPPPPPPPLAISLPSLLLHLPPYLSDAACGLQTLRCDRTFMSHHSHRLDVQNSAPLSSLPPSIPPPPTQHFSTGSSSPASYFTVTSRAGPRKKKKKQTKKKLTCPLAEMKSAAFPQERHSGSHRCGGAFRCCDGRRWRLMPLRSRGCTALKQKVSVVKVRASWRR